MNMHYRRAGFGGGNAVIRNLFGSYRIVRMFGLIVVPAGDRAG
jgi:hypothetical protein